MNRVYWRSTILVSAGDVELAKFKRQYLAPGEMEQIILSRQQLDLTEGDHITVSIEESEK